MIRQTICSFRLLTLCLTAAVVVSPLWGQEQLRVEVSPDGPIATLEDARLKVRELKEKHPGQPIEVLIKGGTYPLRETCLLYTSPSPRDRQKSRMPSSA